MTTEPQLRRCLWCVKRIGTESHWHADTGWQRATVPYLNAPNVTDAICPFCFELEREVILKLKTK